MKIRMSRTQAGSTDGTTVRDYRAGEVYDLTATPGARDLARVFVGEGWAEEVRETPPPVTPEKPAAHPVKTRRKKVVTPPESK
jgi:hypothetical protein